MGFGSYRPGCSKNICCMLWREVGAWSSVVYSMRLLKIALYVSSIKTVSWFKEYVNRTQQT